MPSVLLKRPTSGLSILERNHACARYTPLLVVDPHFQFVGAGAQAVGGNLHTVIAGFSRSGHLDPVQKRDHRGIEVVGLHV